MLSCRRSWPVFLVVLVYLLLPCTDIRAGEKKGDEDKKPETRSKFVAKATELKLTDGKLVQAAEFTRDDPKALGRFHYHVFAVPLKKGKAYRIDYKSAGDDPKF